MTGRRYRAAGPCRLARAATLHKAFQPTLEGSLRISLRDSAISPLRAPFALCRTKSTTAARSSAMSSTRRFAMIRSLLIARLQVLRQLKHESAPITRESRHIIENRAINVMRFARIWRDAHTHQAISARPPLTRIAQDLQRAAGGRHLGFFASSRGSPAAIDAMGSSPFAAGRRRRPHY